MTRDQAIRKVLACLRLGKSASEHEAAAAMRQARALMAKYGLDVADVEHAEVQGADAPTRSRGAMIPVSVSILTNVIRQAFGVESIVIARPSSNGFGQTVVRFYGVGAASQVAAYAFTVLRRQMDADKARHTRRVKKQAIKTARAETFAQAWAYAVSALFPDDVLSLDARETLVAARKAKHPDSTKADPRDIAKKNRNESADRLAGLMAGGKARLSKGLAEAGPRKLEHAS